MSARLLAACAFTPAPAPAGPTMVMPPASASATRTETAFLCTSTAPSVGFRLRGELTGSRACATPGQSPGDSPQRPEGRIGSPVRPTRKRDDSASGQAGFYQHLCLFSCKLHDLLQNGLYEGANPRHLALDRGPPEHRRGGQLVLDPRAQTAAR